MFSLNLLYNVYKYIFKVCVNNNVLNVKKMILNFLFQRVFLINK